MDNGALQRWALVAEIAAAICVVLSLIFVGVQLNEGNRETRAATIQAGTDQQLAMMSELIRYADIWEKVLSGQILQSGEETRRGIILFNMVMTENENTYFQYKSGYLNEDPWNGRLANLEILANLPIFDTWSQSVGAKGHDQEFLGIVAEMNRSNQ